MGAKRDLIQFDFLDLLSLKSGAASEVIILANCFLLWIVRARAPVFVSCSFLASSVEDLWIFV